MKKTILASFFLAFLSFGATATVCESSSCGTLTLPQNPPVVSESNGGACQGCDLYEETPVVPSLEMKNLVVGDNPCYDCLFQPAVPKEIKNLVADDRDCGGCKTEITTPAQLITESSGGMCDGSNCKTQTPTPAQMKNLVANGGGICAGCDLYEETPVVPSLEMKNVVTESSGGMCDGSNCKTQTPVVPSLKDAKMVAPFCFSSWCRSETPVVPSIKDAKMVASGGFGCGSCD